ncbi:MAG: tRNA (adenosine(37)-N6)-dimethylallyltransferase MiaA [Phycisphaerales bacterium]|nr:tRNA (adenosine(37)-N6)-dimethylallyltransferase MiaA [Phycisphaerales bacterium]
MFAVQPLRAILILGPTASGKSALAMAIAARLGGKAEIVSADSMQIYRGMDIGTAKPTPREQSQVAHHMIDLVEPSTDGYSVERWRSEALAAIAALNADDKCAIVVGGTNLYVQALLLGLFEGPPADEALREELRALPLAQLHATLHEIDPESATRIHPNDQRRLIRAIEVTRATGTPLSTLQSQWSSVPPTLPAGWVCAGLLPDAPSNARAINLRVRTMMELGFLDEVRQLLDVSPLGRQAAEAVGYRELTRHLTGMATIEGAVEDTQRRTRALARRQRTWLKRFERIEGSIWSREAPEALRADSLAAAILARQ